MRPLPHPSVSPLPSYATRPEFEPRPVSFAETFGAVWGWLRGVRPNWRETAREVVGHESGVPDGRYCPEHAAAIERGDLQRAGLRRKKRDSGQL
jgi:hypothetical protein